MIKKIISISGAIFLIAGCFFPVMHVMDDTLNFFDKVPANVPNVPPNALLYAAIIFILIGVSVIVLSLLNKTKMIWLAGAASSLCIAALYECMHLKIGEMKSQADEQVGTLFGGMLKGLADTLLKTVELGGAGWYILAIGSLLIIISSLIKTTTNT